MEALLVPISLLAGGSLALQAGANTQLSKATGNPLAATLLQLAVATIVLLVVALPTGSLVALANLAGVPWWHAVGGTASAFFVVSTILLFPRLGAVVSVGLIIAGQMLASLILDGFGLFGVPEASFGVSTLMGTLAVLGGTVAIVVGQSGAGDHLSVAKLGWVLLALSAGAALPVQGAVNGLLKADLGAPLPVGVISFLVASLAMAGMLLALLLFTTSPRPQLANVRGMPWWGWLGGFAGALYVTTMFMAIPVIGTASAVGLTVAGQQTASVFVDRYGLFRLPQRPVSPTQLCGRGDPADRRRDHQGILNQQSTTRSSMPRGSTTGCARSISTSMCIANRDPRRGAFVGWRSVARCAHGKRDGMKSIRECTYGTRHGDPGLDWRTRFPARVDPTAPTMPPVRLSEGDPRLNPAGRAKRCFRPSALMWYRAARRRGSSAGRAPHS